jgi:hypothetical protein
MFKLAVSETFTAPVSLELPGENGIREIKKFKAVFERPDQEAVDDLHEKALAGEMDDQKTIDTYMKGWKDVADQAGTPLEFSADNLARLLRINGARKAIAKAFVDAVYGAPVKN